MHTITIRFPPHVARLFQCLFTRHMSLPDADRREVDAIIGAKELAELAGAGCRNRYDVRAYIFRARRLIKREADAVGVPGLFRDFLVSRNGWGYALRPDLVVTLRCFEQERLAVAGR